MKSFITVLTLLFSICSFAQYANTGWQYNPVRCSAQTICPNGAVISCQTVGFNYGNAPRIASNMCRTRVVPGNFVHCQGYADQVDIYGRIVFIPANLPVSCY